MDRTDPARLPWHIVLPLGTGVGVLYALLTIFGWINGMEGWIALALIGVMGAIIALTIPRRPARNGFITGFLAALFAVELQDLFLPLYFENNPEYANVEIPFGLSPRLATALFAPLHAVLAGILTAASSWLAFKLPRKN